MKTFVLIELKDEQKNMDYLDMAEQVRAVASMIEEGFQCGVEEDNAGSFEVVDSPRDQDIGHMYSVINAG